MVQQLYQLNSMKAYLTGDGNYIVKLGTQSSYKAVQSEAIVTQNFTDLSDVNIEGLSSSNDNYPVVYNASLGKFVIVDPDVILSTASTTGLPSDFIDTLDVELDDRIDLDAGTF